MQILNVNLIKHPVNWIIVILMLFIAGYAGHLFLTYLGIDQDGKGNPKIQPSAGGGFKKGSAPPAPLQLA